MLTTAERVSKARSRLVIDDPWIGSLSLKLTMTPDAKTETNSTDGTSLFYNEEWTANQSDDVLKTLIAHETYHCALLHPYRLGNRDLKRANEAMDYVINGLLVKDGYRLWDGALYDKKYDGMDFETVYAKLDADEDGNQPQPQPGGCSPAPEPQPGDDDADESGDGQTPKPEPLSATDWQIATEQASLVGLKAGTASADSVRAARATHQSKTPWYDILRDFVIRTVPSDYSMSRPNRQYASRGLYVPGLIKENAPPFVLGVDTSASITQEMLDAVAVEINAIMREVRPESLTCIYCDYDVTGVETFDADDDVKLNLVGGGGTRFTPVFEHVAKLEEPPAALIYFTDLEGDSPAEPDYPVLWLTPESTTLTGPFGETVRFSLYQ